MYVPPAFAENDPQLLREMMRAHPLGALVTLTRDGLTANHIPFLVDAEPAPTGTLRGHVARSNPVWRDAMPDADALVLFTGPDAYVSPSWYPSKEATGKAVPTWNYVVVHAHGPLRIIEDPSWLRAHVEALTNAQEQDRAQPWRVTDAPGEFVEGLIRSIVGIEIPIARLEGKWKLSQNRSAADRDGVVAGLRRDDAAAALVVAEIMDRAIRKDA
jgi:transcriptional regulator